MTDNDIGMKQLNFWHDPDRSQSVSEIQEKYFQFNKCNLFVTWPLDDAPALFGRTYGDERIIKGRLTSVSRWKLRGTE